MKKKINKTTIAHMVILSLIAAIFLFSAIKLILWNHGKNYDIFDEGPEDEFFVQNEDYITYMNPDLLQGIEDDGITTVVFLGDDMLSDYSDSEGIPALFQEAFPDSMVYNCSFSGAFLSVLNPAYDPAYPIDVFSPYWLMQCITQQNYSLLYAAAGNMPEQKADYENTIRTMEAIDFMKVDAITILYGTNDYLNGRLITNVYDLSDIGSYTGALQSTIELIKAAYPHIRIIVMSPTFCMVKNANGEFSGCDTANTGYGALADYMVAAKNIAVEANVTFLDNYYGTGININTYEDYLEPDWIHPNAAARKIIAGRIAHVLMPSQYEQK